MAERETQVIEPKAVTATMPKTAPLPEPAKKATGRDLLDNLLISGSPPKKLAEAEKWLAEQPNGNDTPAEALYRHLEAYSGPDAITIGTLRKAGKFVFGDGFEPEHGEPYVPAEELTKLRSEIERLKRTNEQLNRDKVSYLKQRDLAQERCNELSRKVQILSAGRPRQELIDMGVVDMPQAV